jgi:alpha-amylase/alpha-mannosidase (GH57 family)
MPLANDRDKQTQVIWGLRDFEYRFKRKPEGMWLPETAVNVKTLEILAEHGIQFTILAPTQAKRIKRLGDRKWMDVSEGTIDTQLPYTCPLPSGRQINLFFYHGAIANEVAFGDLLKNGVNFANRLVGEFPEHQQRPRLIHVANDGETYGHHHSFGNMALAYMLHHVEMNQMAQLTVYGEFLEKFPPTHEVEIINDTSWSCFHGIERWRSHCGCRLDVTAQWSQEWRKYLREVLDWLRDELANIFQAGLGVYCNAPWSARDQYISVILDPTEANRQKFLKEIGVKSDPNESRQVFALLEMQRYALLMYTSCGWFFDDISGLETVQILQYAARAMQLAKEVAGKDLEEKFLQLLGPAKSNIPEMGDGWTIYHRFVKPVVKSLR